MAKPIGVAIIGMGGFAQSHHHAVAALEHRGLCRLIATCDPNVVASAGLAQELRFAERKVRCYNDYRTMLAAECRHLDVVAIPTPVPLHAEMHAASLQHGLAVYLEKPPTLDHRELEEMIARDARAGKQTNVGFNHIAEEPRQGLKQRLVAGEFGRVRQVSYFGLWPRPASYFQRTYWAGRLRVGRQLVLDSCMGNAQAHFVHNALYWAGVAEPNMWAQVEVVSAELYRAHEIESFDTVFVKAVTKQGVQIRLAQSHACDGEHRQLERVRCDCAAIEYDVYGGSWRIVHQDGHVEEGKPGDSSLAANMEAYLAYVGGTAERPVTRLVDSRPFVHLYDLAIIAGEKIHQVSEPNAKRSQDGDDYFAVIRGLDGAVSRFLADGLFPSEQGLAWGASGGRATPADLPRLPETVASMMART